jgi:hypothetical protein
MDLVASLEVEQMPSSVVVDSVAAFDLHPVA